IAKEELNYAPDAKKGRVIKNAPTTSNKGVYQYAPTNKFTSPSQTLGAIIRGFKAATATRIKIMSDNSINKLWQRSFYDHIIRNEKELHQIREYIAKNPLIWQVDEL
ncbi:MAG: transposase, partial [Candidatus Zixiibacteriota bacterium]